MQLTILRHGIFIAGRHTICMAGIRPLSLIALGLAFSLATAAMSRANRDFVLERLMPIPVADAAIMADPTRYPAKQEQKISRENDGLFYVKASVNGRTLRFLVDTGASVVVLTAADARAIGLRADETHFGASVETAGGATPMAWTTIDTVSIGKRNIHRIRAAVLPHGLKVSLLGQNALSQLGALTIDGDSLKFS